MTVAVDWDGVLVGPAGDWLPGATQALRILRRDHKLLIHSCRANYTPGREQIVAKLAAARLDIPVWDNPGKPLADVYLDDRGLRFSDWPTALRALRTL